jgi:DNA uptake protein ComE-like DNA-binding protein
MKRKSKLYFFLMLLLIWPVLYGQNSLLDINNATLEQIRQLPVSAEQANAIYHRILYEGPFQSVYELLELPEMDIETFKKIKPLVIINPYRQKSDWEQRVEQLLYQMERWEGSEGINQALVDYWYEQAFSPLDVNQMRYDQVANLQGVSPVDAAAIIKYRQQVGQIFSQRDLRSAPFLSYYGFRNARNFITFDGAKEPTRNEFHGHYRIRMDTAPLLADESDAQEQIPVSEDANSYPTMYSSLSATFGNLKLGMSQYHFLGEPYYYENLGILNFPKSKFYIGLENQKFGPFQFRKIYTGYYSLAFGKSVIMNNTDYFVPRRTGFGYRKNFLGLRGDNSINRQFALRGIAAEMSYKNLDAFFFLSYNSRDAILNTVPSVIDGKSYTTVNQFIVLDQRFRFATTDSLRIRNNLSWLNAVNELLYGTHLQYNFSPGSYIGYTFYESLYDKFLRPRIDEIVAPENLGQVSAPDVEIYSTWGGPQSDIESPVWGAAKSFRRVYGFDFQYVYKNVAFQGEYGELDVNNNFSLFSGNPSALVLDAYIQFNSLNILALYRNYDVGFDNPYQRSFSNYRRFKRTIYEDYFYLQDPLYGQLYFNNPQPQAEKGFYIRSRYQINRYLVSTIEYDNWIRKSDDASQHRFVASLDIRPIFPLRINLRQKFQGREVNNQQSLEYFENKEFIGRIRLLLSDYNQVGLLFFNSTTLFRPRPRLVFPVTGGNSVYNVLRSGNMAANSRGIGAFFNYRFGEWLKVKGYLGYYRGFMWNFEDTQFQVMNSLNGAYRAWLSFYHRLSSHLSIRLKLTWDTQNPIYGVESRDSRNQPITNTGKYYQANFVQDKIFFYLFELNYHF